MEANKAYFLFLFLHLRSLFFNLWSLDFVDLLANSLGSVSYNNINFIKISGLFNSGEGLRIRIINPKIFENWRVRDINVQNIIIIIIRKRTNLRKNKKSVKKCTYIIFYFGFGVWSMITIITTFGFFINLSKGFNFIIFFIFIRFSFIIFFRFSFVILIIIGFGFIIFFIIYFSFIIFFIISLDKFLFLGFDLIIVFGFIRLIIFFIIWIFIFKIIFIIFSLS